MAAIETLPVDYGLVIYTGTTFRREFRWLPDGSAALDFTDWSASLMIGVQGSRTPMVSLTSDPGGGIELSTTGQIVVTLPPAVTSTLKPGSFYDWLDLTGTAGTVLRFLRGRVDIITDSGRFT